MPSVLICCGSIGRELPRTVLWRNDMERRVAHNREEALDLAGSSHFDLGVVVDDIGSPGLLIRDLRSGPSTRSLSIAVVMTHADFQPADLDLIDAGANAILRPPAGPEWDHRLGSLMHVPPRRAGRFPIEMRVEGQGAEIARSVAGTVLNLSEQGILVETDVPLPLGADIDFRIHLRDAPAPLRGCGQIVRQESPLRGGIRFYALEPHGLARVRRFVRR